MPTFQNKNIRKVTKLGGKSYAVTIPISMMRKLKWKERQKVVVKKRGKKIIIEDWRGQKMPTKGKLKK